MSEVAALRLEGFTSIDHIGTGGMGSVFCAFDEHSGRQVAIKCLNSDALANASESIQRFQREGEILRKLNHPNIVQLLTTLEDHNNYYLIMEYVSGGSLETRLKQQPQLPIEQVLSTALELTDALARAHHLNIIHRDIKPANVLIAEDGTPRLTDFGIAWMINRPHLTSENAILGTPHYLSPEVIRQQTIDVRCDIWSLGVLLFEMVAGQLPFQGNSFYQTITAILQNPTPNLTSLRSEAPIALVDLLYRMLEKEPAARVPTMRQVGVELEKIIRSKDFAASQNSRSVAVSGDYSTLFASRITPPAQVLSNLPAQTTAFIGRAIELEQLATLLQDSPHCVLTILGSGGMGKTRLSLEVASRHVSHFQHGVYFVPLESLTDATFIAPAVSKAIGLASGHTDPGKQLLDYLRDRQLLLVLDNFENVLDGAEFVVQILENAPDVRILVSSREKLCIQEEVLFRIEGMSIPERETAKDAADSNAVQLFLQGARRVQPGFKLDDENQRYVVRICHLVDGMPLAILLAAAWVELFSPKEIAEEISRGLDLLQTEVRNMPLRHRSIRAIFASTWNQLTEAEQAICARLSVFHGGFTRESAQVVAQASLQDLIMFVNKSLLRRDLAGRYSVHPLLQQFFAEQLHNTGGTAEAYKLHSAHFAALIHQWGIEFKKSPRLSAAHEIETELENIRWGWQWAAEHGQLEVISQYSSGLWQYQNSRSWYLGGIDALRTYDKAIQQMDGLPQEPTWSRTLACLYESAGQLLCLVGQHEEVIKHCRQALKYIPADETVWQARLYRQIGNSLRMLRRPKPALASYVKAEEVLGKQPEDASTDWWYEWVQVQLERSWLHYWQNEWHEFANLDENVRGWVEQHGTLAQQVNFFNCLAVSLGRHDHYVYNDKILSYSRMALEKSLQSNNPADIAWSQFVHGMALLFSNHFGESEELLREALTRAEENRDIVHQARCVTYLTIAYRKQWLVELVRQYAARSLEIASAAKMPEYVGIAKANQAWVAWCDGTVVAATSLAQEALQIWGALDTSFASLAWRWVAYWPLMGVALKHQQVGQAVDYAREILDPSQQRLSDAITNALCDGIHAWDSGQYTLSQRYLFQALENSGDLPRNTISTGSDSCLETLTSREQEVLKLVAAGLSNQEIATQLAVGITTVKKHINHIFLKLGVDSRTRAIVRAKELSLL